MSKMTLYEKIRQEQHYNNYKSDGERRIADFLNKKNIPFTYEKPLAVVDDRKTRIFYPDFSLHDFNTII